MTLLQKARKFAKEAHDNTNHLYDGKPYYDVHVEEYVMKWAEKFIYIIPNDENYHEEVLAACTCHDVIEDCRMTYNDVKNATNKRVADLVYAVTNEKGKNRSDRANDTYYKGILDEKFAVFIKLADRLGNVEYSMKNSRAQNDTYRKEYGHFKKILYKNFMYAEMWHELDLMLLSTDDLNILKVGDMVNISLHPIIYTPHKDNFIVTNIKTKLVTNDLSLTQFCTYIDVLNAKDMCSTIKDVEVFRVKFI